MILSRPRIAIVVAIFCIGGNCASYAQGIPSTIHYTFFSFGQQPDASGDMDYFLEVGHGVGVASAVTDTLVSPDGTSFTGISTVYRNSFAEIASLAFGVWTATEKYDAVDITYQFQMNPFDLSEVFTDTATILSPLPGSTVPQQFEVRWEYPNGVVPDGARSFLYSQPQNIATGFPQGQRIPGECCAYSVNARLAGNAPGSISVRTNDISGIPNQPSLIGAIPIPGDRFLINANYESNSAAATYTVVPEPSSLLLALACFSLLAFRRR